MENYKNSFAKRWLSILLMIVMVLSTFTPFTKAAYAAPAQSTAITDEDLAANAYETYYYSNDRQYTYNGEEVSFISETQIQAGDQTLDLKNKPTDITVNVEGSTATISFTNLTTPISYIAGEWSTTYGGTVNLQYNSDIPEKATVVSANKDLEKLVIEGLDEGTYHLTNGTIFEKANEWSGGTDLNGDGKKETEGYFGTLPDITIVVGGSINRRR